MPAFPRLAALPEAARLQRAAAGVVTVIGPLLAWGSMLDVMDLTAVNRSHRDAVLDCVKHPAPRCCIHG